MSTTEKKWVLVLLVIAMSFTGCARQKELERVNREQLATIAKLNNDIAQLNEELKALAAAKTDLDKAKHDLERKLKSELAGGDVTLTMSDRGLVVTVLDRVLFDSGKAQIKTSAEDTLSKVADIINREVKGNVVFVEGHTDNEPIRYSSWKSNWELSTTRATEVIHYLSESAGVDPKRLVASGYAEYRPVTSNDSSTSKQKNRRVEIVISPRKMTSFKPDAGIAKVSSMAGAEEVIK